MGGGEPLVTSVDSSVSGFHRDKPCVGSELGTSARTLSPVRDSFPRGSRTPVLTGTLAGLSAVFGMGTGVAPPLWPP